LASKPRHDCARCSLAALSPSRPSRRAGWASLNRKQRGTVGSRPSVARPFRRGRFDPAARNRGTTRSGARAGRSYRRPSSPRCWRGSGPRLSLMNPAFRGRTRLGLGWWGVCGFLPCGCGGVFRNRRMLRSIRRAGLRRGLRFQSPNNQRRTSPGPSKVLELSGRSHRYL